MSEYNSSTSTESIEDDNIDCTLDVDDPSAIVTVNTDADIENDASNVDDILAIY